jgi:hypothetical protein
MNGLPPGAEPHTQLDRPAASPEPASRPRVPLAAEALGYAGGVLAIAAGLFLVRDSV